MVQFHPTDPRFLRRRSPTRATSAALAGEVSPPPPVAVTGDLIWIPLGFGARVTVYGRDANETNRDIEGLSYASSNTGIFTVTTYKTRPREVLLRSVSVGQAFLTITADAEVGPPDVDLSDTLTINVYEPATQLVLYYRLDGSDEELLVPRAPDGTPQVGTPADPLPRSTNVYIRVEGQTDEGIVVPLTSPVFTPEGLGTYSLTVDPTDSNIVTLTPAAGGNELLVVTADGDPSPITSSLTLTAEVNISDDPIATHLEEVYSIEPIGPPRT